MWEKFPISLWVFQKIEIIEGILYNETVHSGTTFEGWIRALVVVSCVKLGIVSMTTIHMLFITKNIHAYDSLFKKLSQLTRTIFVHKKKMCMYDTTTAGTFKTNARDHLNILRYGSCFCLLHDNSYLLSLYFLMIQIFMWLKFYWKYIKKNFRCCSSKVTILEAYN